MTSTRGGRTGGDTERVGQSLFFTHAIHKYHYQNQHKTIERAMGICVHTMRSNNSGSHLATSIHLVDKHCPPYTFLFVKQPKESNAKCETQG